MAYYKISYESDTIEGLQAIRGNFSGQETTTADSGISEIAVPAPPLQQSEEHTDGLSDLVQAPPVTNEITNDSGFSDGNTIPSPPLVTADSGSSDNRLEEEIPPPPLSELQNQDGNGGESGEVSVPPRQPASKGPKVP